MLSRNFLKKLLAALLFFLFIFCPVVLITNPVEKYLY